MALGKACRFRTRCELIIVHQDELEHELVIALETRDPGVIGNEYAVLGTVDGKPWRKALEEGHPPVEDAFDHVADFEKEYDLHYEPGGWERA